MLKYWFLSAIRKKTQKYLEAFSIVVIQSHSERHIECVLSSTMWHFGSDVAQLSYECWFNSHDHCNLQGALLQVNYGLMGVEYMRSCQKQLTSKLDFRAGWFKKTWLQFISSLNSTTTWSNLAAILLPLENSRLKKWPWVTKRAQNKSTWNKENKTKGQYSAVGVRPTDSLSAICRSYN